MDAYTGIYYSQNHEPQEATILLLPDKISIGIRDASGNPKVVYWHYRDIARDPFWKGDRAVIKLNSPVFQHIEVGSMEFLQKLEAIFEHRQKPWISRAFNKNMMHMIRVLAVVLAVLIAAYIWLIPFLAERLARKVPVSYEEGLGNGIFDALKTGLIIDDEKTAYINEFFREMDVPTEYDIRITVVDEDIANAFALPGGRIVVYDKIITGMDHYEDLAALLMHEFTHVDKRHTTRSLFRQLGASVFLSIIIGDVGSVANLIIQQADNLKGLNYSRRLEKEADLNGLQLLTERKIDANGFIRLFELLKNETNDAGVKTAEWISSHPDLDKRIAYIRDHETFNKNGVLKNETLEALFLKIKNSR